MSGYSTSELYTSFPFEWVVVTFPDAESAKFAAEGPLKRLQQQLVRKQQFQDDDDGGVVVTATSDPHNSRVGSGGGTLSALRYVAEREEQIGQHRPKGRQYEPTILILHAGGESSRCPTQMVLGKAWTSLPSGGKQILTPIEYWILHLCPRLFSGGSSLESSRSSKSSSTGISDSTSAMLRLPPGSIVVVASDTLLQIPAMSSPCYSSFSSSDNIPANAVLALAVPAPLATAKNHGVFICEATDDKQNTTEVASVVPCLAVLQKPSVETLLQPGKHFRLTTSTPSDTTHCEIDLADDSTVTWIDTGVTIFFPNSADSLRRLACHSTVAQRCTERGLTELYQLHLQNSKNMKSDCIESNYTPISHEKVSSTTPSSLKEFATLHAAKIDLYTHILQALTLALSTPQKQDLSRADTRRNIYIQQQTEYSKDKITREDAACIYDELNECPLQIWTITGGNFLHLGTTAELHEFLLQSDNQQHSNQDSSLYRRRALCRLIGKELKLTKRMNAVTILGSPSVSHPTPSIFDNIHENDSNIHTRTSTVDPSAVLYNCILHTSPLTYNSSPTAFEQSSHATQTSSTSVLPSSSSIGHNTVMEHCCYDSCSFIQIGSNCLISGLRSNNFLTQPKERDKILSQPPNSFPSPASSYLQIPADMIVQMIPLKNDKGSIDTSVNIESVQTAYVLVVLGMSDNIKTDDTLFNSSIHTFMDWTGLLPNEIGWGSNSSQRSIWNAKIHPVIQLDRSDDVDDSSFSFTDLYSWLVQFTASTNDTAHISSTTYKNNIEYRASLERWKRSKRLSLSEIRDASDSYAEFAYRERIEQLYIPAAKQSHCKSVVDILTQHRNDYIDLQYIIDDVCANKDVDINKIRDASTGCTTYLDSILSTLGVFDTIMFRHGAVDDDDDKNNYNGYDVFGRVLMVFSGFFTDLASAFTSDTPASNGLPAQRHQNEDISIRTKIIEKFHPTLELLRYNDGRQTLKYYETLYHSDIVQNRDSILRETTDFMLDDLSRWTTFQALATVMEQLAQVMTRTHINQVLRPLSRHRTGETVYNQWVVATAPARIDLAGGWSDTPPICYEIGSKVVGVAVTINNTLPLAARCRIVQGKTGISLRAESRDMTTGSLISDVSIELFSFADFADYNDPTADCALLKCVLIISGLISVDQIRANNDGKTNNHVAISSSPNLQDLINGFCNRETDCCLELVSTSLLPQGSGLGTSSILAGCLLAALGKCTGLLVTIKTNENCDNSTALTSSFHDALVGSVLQVEQLLTTGGGYQDQVNGLVGGIKLSCTEPSVSFRTMACKSMMIDIERITSEDDAFEQKLSQSLVLVFTGQTRLAKNLLVSVLRRWSKRTPEICQTVTRLIEGANKCNDCIREGDLDGVGSRLSEYWNLKKQMAGPDSGVEPPAMKELFDILFDSEQSVHSTIALASEQKLVRGASLCGAGGGGFLAILLADGIDHTILRKHIEARLINQNKGTIRSLDASLLSWYTCKVCQSGLTVRVLSSINDCDNKNNSNTCDFDISWLQTS